MPETPILRFLDLPLLEVQDQVFDYAMRDTLSVRLFHLQTRTDTSVGS